MISFFMRMVALLLMGMFLLPAPMKAQKEMDELRIKCRYSDQALDLVFLDLKINYRLEFEYDEIEIEGIRISQIFGRLPLNEAMGLLLQGTGLSFEVTPPPAK